jgi:hypothetical protein
MAPPVTYAGEYNTGTRMDWGLYQGNPVVTFRMKIGSIQLRYYQDTGAFFGTDLVNQAGVHLGGAHFPFACHDQYTPSMLLQLIELFTKNIWLDLCYEFVPRVASGTSSPYALTWAYVDDPMYAPSHSWVTNNPGNGLAVSATESQIASMEGAKQFPVWQPLACMRAGRLDKKTWQYVANPYFDDAGAFNPGDSSITPADVRMATPGMLAFSGSENTIPSSGTNHTVVSTSVGSLFYTGKIVLSEYNPPISDDTPGLNRGGHISRRGRPYEEKKVSELDCQRSKSRTR